MVSITIDGHTTSLEKYVAETSQRIGSIIVLSGSRGLRQTPSPYAAYGSELARAGFDVYLLPYLSAGDVADLKTLKASARQDLYAAKLPNWARQVSDLITAIDARNGFHQPVGLLGFSLGGFVALPAAADARVSAAAILYGAIHPSVHTKISRLPPLLVVHGKSDQAVPVSKTHEIAQLGASLGTPVKLVVLPGQPHGFDFQIEKPVSKETRATVVEFFQRKFSANGDADAPESSRGSAFRPIRGSGEH